MSYSIHFEDIENCIEREEWAINHCKTFLYRVVTDVSDVSPSSDTYYDFYFGDEKDAMWFRLYWS